MERWRWYPRDLGNAHVMVNLPDFTLKVMHNGAQVWTTRIVIGKPDKPTPLLSETMKYITINPTWNVPPSIVYNEYLPALQQDPTVLERMGLKLVNNRDGSVHIYSAAGRGQRARPHPLQLPEPFLVYQHDTPDKHLFAHDTRAYSHGCMRVQDPAKYAEVLFNIARPSENWTAETDQADVRHRRAGHPAAPTPIWVHLTYQTAFVDDAGKLQIRRDVYGSTAARIAAIKSERAHASNRSQERKRDQEVASTGQRPRRVRRPRHRASSRSSSRCSAAASRDQATAGAAAPHHSLIMRSIRRAPDAKRSRRAVSRLAQPLRILCTRITAASFRHSPLSASGIGGTGRANLALTHP